MIVWKNAFLNGWWFSVKAHMQFFNSVTDKFLRSIKNSRHFTQISSWLFFFGRKRIDEKSNTRNKKSTKCRWTLLLGLNVSILSVRNYIVSYWLKNHKTYWITVQIIFKFHSFKMFVKLKCRCCRAKFKGKSLNYAETQNMRGERKKCEKIL